MNFYRDAASILDQLDNRRGTVKGLCLQDTVRDKKKMYAIVCETLKAKSILLEILDKANFFNQAKKKKLSRNLVLVLAHDLLFRKRGIQAPAGPIKEAILDHKVRLKAELAKLRIQKGVLNNSDLTNQTKPNQVPIPRYIRVNTIKTSTSEVISCFEKEGYSKAPSDVNWSDKNVRYIAIDNHINHLLLLPSRIDLHSHSLLTSGKIVLQDKASCFPAYILNPPPGAQVIDACAAPGNKTSHLAMIMSNFGTIWALDLDKRRLNTLKTLTSRAGATIIKPINVNFLELNPLDVQFAEVEYLLLDPSCSGSGIVSRLDFLVDSDEAESEDTKSDRLVALAEFQCQIIEHAMKFPRARRIVYSTCSIHPEENESVVARILENHDHEWQLVNALPSWPRRGLSVGGLSDDQVRLLVRCDPEEDATNGFFVALFEKKHIGPPLIPHNIQPSEIITNIDHTFNPSKPKKDSIITKEPTDKLKSLKKRAPKPMSKRKIYRSVTST